MGTSYPLYSHNHTSIVSLYSPYGTYQLPTRPETIVFGNPDNCNNVHSLLSRLCISRPLPDDTSPRMDRLPYRGQSSLL